MLGILEGLMDFIDSLPTWQKWLGTSTIGVFLFFLFLLIFAGPHQTAQVAGIPGEIKQVESNITTEYIAASKEPARDIIGDFRQTGDDLAKEVKDPSAARAIRFSWSMLGVYLVLLIIAIPLLALHRAFSRIL